MSNFEVELTELRNENKLLKELLVSHGISLPIPTDKKIAFKSNHPLDSVQLNPTEKIKLFRSLFRGRDDVYPIRWESSQSGKTGYSPVCAVGAHRILPPPAGQFSVRVNTNHIESTRRTLIMNNNSILKMTAGNACAATS